MKKIILCLLILLVSGCSKNSDNTTTIKLTKTNIEYGEEIALNDFITIENGKITSKDDEINTEELGKQKIVINYLDSNNSTKTFTTNIVVVDTTAPVIFNSNTYYLEQGKDEDLISKIFCGDNYDRDLKCLLEGTYDINVLGEYNLSFTATDSSNNTTKKEFKLIVKEEITNEYDDSYYQISDLISNYKTKDTMIGIDVSTWQGDIDWQKVKKAGIEFAFIRIGYGYNDEGKNVLDNKFHNNLKNAKEAGILVGLYFYSYAKTEKEAIDQANWIIDTLNNEKLDLPIAFDWEDWSDFSNYKFNFLDLNKIAKAFLTTIENNNYQGMIYGSANYLNRVWNLPKYTTWLAHYTNKTDYEKDYYVWQLANNGQVSGIYAYVDLDILYIK